MIVPLYRSLRKDHDRGREKDERESRRGDASDRGLRDGLVSKDRGARETTLERGGGNRSGKDDPGNRRDDSISSRDSSRKRESQMLPGIVEKTAQDKDFIPKSKCSKLKIFPSPIHSLTASVV
jgi:hypothetical protein